VVPENRHLRPGVQAANPGVGRVVPRHDAMAPWSGAAVPGIGQILRVILRATHRFGRRVSRHDLTVPWRHAMVPRLGGGSKEPRYGSRGRAGGSVAPHPESWGRPHGSTRSAPDPWCGLKKSAQAAMNPRIHRTNPRVEPSTRRSAGWFQHQRGPPIFRSINPTSSHRLARPPGAEPCRSGGRV
jgi:hypothetical protein